MRLGIERQGYSGQVQGVHLVDVLAEGVSSGSSKYEDPFIHYPLDPATNDYVQKELAPLSQFGKQTHLQFTESIIELDADKIAKDIECPLFIDMEKTTCFIQRKNHFVFTMQQQILSSSYSSLMENITILCIMNIRYSRT
jgi:hypothetical protein